MSSQITAGADMATILEFRHGQKASGGHRGGSAPPAEIVFFPGVRYERWAEVQPAETSKKRLRRRDKLQIDD